MRNEARSGKNMVEEPQTISRPRESIRIEENTQEQDEKSRMKFKVQMKTGEVMCMERSLMGMTGFTD